MIVADREDSSVFTLDLFIYLFTIIIIIYLVSSTADTFPFSLCESVASNEFCKYALQMRVNAYGIASRFSESPKQCDFELQN